MGFKMRWKFCNSYKQHFLRNFIVTEFWKLVYFWLNYHKKIVWVFFMTYRVNITTASIIPQTLHSPDVMTVRMPIRCEYTRLCEMSMTGHLLQYVVCCRECEANYHLAGNVISCTVNYRIFTVRTMSKSMRCKATRLCKTCSTVTTRVRLYTRVC